MRAPGDVLLVACYELGHQPLAIAWPAATLERHGYAPATLDVSVEPFDPARAARARLVAIAVPMHTALRLGVKVAERVRAVRDVTRDPLGVERELALVKVKGTGEARIEAMRVSEIFRANIIDTNLDSFVFEVTGAPSKIDKFLDLMRPLGLVELSRTGVLSITRGTGV